MNDHEHEELRELERELATLSAPAPPARLRERIGRDLDAPCGRRGRGVFHSFVGAGLAACLALAAFLGLFEQGASPMTEGADEQQAQTTARALAEEAVITKAQPAEEAYQLVDVKQYLASQEDEGIVYINDETPARQYRYQMVNLLTWENPADGSRMTMTLPRERVVQVPLDIF